VPWSYLPHNRTSALQAFLEATSIYGSDLKAISVDRYDPALLQSVLESGGIHGTKILRAPFDFEEPGFEKKLQDFHRDCYLRGEVSVCFTSMEHIYEPLRSEGIPCIRIYPSEEVVHEQVYHLQILDISARENQGKYAVIAIHFDYIFDSEQDLSIREWEKMKYQNEFKERVYAAAQRMEAAVFGGGYDRYDPEVGVENLTKVIDTQFTKSRSGASLNMLRCVWTTPTVMCEMVDLYKEANPDKNVIVVDIYNYFKLMEQDLKWK